MKKYLVMSIIVFSLIALSIFYRIMITPVARTKSDAPSKHIVVRIPLHAWSFEPDHIVAVAGEALSITVINEDDIEHGFAIEEYRVHKSIPAFSISTLPTLTFSKEGKLQFYCSEICGDGTAERGEHKGDKRGHFDMTGELNVLSK